MYTSPKNSLSIEAIQGAFRVACRDAILDEHHSLQCLDESHVDAVLQKMGRATNQTSPQSAADGFQSNPPFYYGVVLVDKNNDTGGSTLFGFAICYFAFSTWEGRVLFLNHVFLDESVDGFRESVMRTLANAAVSLDCTRLVWNHCASTRPTYSKMGAHTLDGWLNLRMDKIGINSFIGTRPELVPSERIIRGPLSVSIIDSVLDKTLMKVNIGLKGVGLRLKRTVSEDVPSIQRLIQGLADYEKEPDAVNVTGEQFRLDGFDTESPLFYCLLLEDAATGIASGMAFIFFGYDVSFGRFIYLEDLFFEEKSRGKGAGKMVMFALAMACHLLGCDGLMWQALDWNTPALTFYGKIGAKVMDGLLTTRFAGQDLIAFASK